jgi:hypothetical protein
MHIGEILRTSAPPQTDIITLTDCSAESDKVPVLFVGDLFNFWKTADLPDDVIAQYIDHVEQLFRGFFDEQFVFGAESEEEAEVSLEFFKLVGGNAALAADKERRRQFQLMNLIEYRLLNPLFFLEPRHFGHLTQGKQAISSKVALLRFLSKIRKCMA